MASKRAMNDKFFISIVVDDFAATTPAYNAQTASTRFDKSERTLINQYYLSYSVESLDRRRRFV
jgi:hypothetical protein